MSEQLSNSALFSIHESAGLKQTFPDDVKAMAEELLNLRAVVANAIELINSGRCGLGVDVLITGKLNNE